MAYNKYGAKKTKAYGYSFASQGEKSCFEYLKLLEKAGELKIEQSQDHVYLTRARILYIADFKIIDHKLQEEVWIEFKGYETDTWKLKKRLWAFYGPGRLRIYKGQGLRMVLVDEIIPHLQAEDLQ